MKNVFVAFLVSLIIIMSVAASVPAAIYRGNLVLSSATSPHVTNCLAANVTTAVTLTNVQCTQYGSVSVNGSASVTLVDSSLLEVGKGNYAQFNLTQSAKLVMVNSSITNSTIDMTGQTSLSASSGSLLSLEDFRSSGLSTISLYSTRLVDNYRVVNLSSNSINIINSFLSFSTPRDLSFSANVLNFQNSTLESTNSSSFGLSGNSSLTISRTSISSILDTTLFQAVSSERLIFTGGNVSIDSSNILSSGIAPSGYAPAGDSTVNITAADSASISTSNITTGNTNVPITFRTSRLSVDSLKGNLTITNSFLQSLSNSPSVTLTANSPPFSSLTLDHTTIEMQNSSGVIQLASSYSIQLKNARLDGPESNLKVFTKFLLATGSKISDSNITKDLSFGFGLESGTFYNTNFAQCQGSPQNCLSVVAQGGSYYFYGLMLVSVNSKNTSQFISGATVTAIDTRTGRTVYSAKTNASGWAEIQPLLVQSTYGTTYAIPSYIIQASGGGEISAQKLVLSNQTIIATLSVDSDISVGFSNSNFAAKSQADIASTFGLNEYSYLYNPPNTYKLGPFIGAEYLPYVTILSNSVPLNYKNNASSSEIDFTTVGDSGGSFYFVVIYPKNFTSGPLALRLDGGYQSGIRVESNSTDYFSTFSIPAGLHSIALVFNLRNGNSIPVDYPNLFPTADVIILIVSLAVVAAILIIAYTVRQRKFRVS